MSWICHESMGSVDNFVDIFTMQSANPHEIRLSTVCLKIIQNQNVLLNQSLKCATAMVAECNSIVAFFCTATRFLCISDRFYTPKLSNHVLDKFPQKALHQVLRRKKLAPLAHTSRLAFHSVNQSRHMTWRRELADAMAEVKNMRLPCA